MFIVDCDGENMTCNTPTHEQTNEREKGEIEILATSINQNIRCMYVCRYLDSNGSLFAGLFYLSFALSLFFSILITNHRETMITWRLLWKQQQKTRCGNATLQFVITWINFDDSICTVYANLLESACGVFFFFCFSRSSSFSFDLCLLWNVNSNV